MRGSLTTRRLGSASFPMTTLFFRSVTLRLLLSTAGLLAAFVSASAQVAGVGTVQGRVVNARSGEYLANARVTVENTALETFTDSDGFYRLTNVPAGARPRHDVLHRAAGANRRG